MSGHACFRRAAVLELFISIITGNMSEKMESQFGSHSSQVDMEAHIMSMVLDKSLLIANNIKKYIKNSLSFN